MNIQAQEIAETIRPILIRHGVIRADLFGSVVRGDAHSKSDVDILVELPQKSSLFDLGGLYMDLKDVLKKEVDVLTYNSVHPYIEKYVYQNTFKII
jgi:predicted nucleotidyltransferase